MNKLSAKPDRDHPLSFLATEFGDAKKYPSLGVSLGSTKDGHHIAYVKQARGCDEPDVFHQVRLSSKPSLVSYPQYSIGTSMAGQQTHSNNQGGIWTDSHEQQRYVLHSIRQRIHHVNNGLMAVAIDY